MALHAARAALLPAALLLLLSPAAHAAKPCTCTDLPALEQELRDQEWLRHAFEQYTPVSSYQLSAKDTKDLQQRVKAKFDKYKASPAGGGSGPGAASLGVDTNVRTCLLRMFDPPDAQGNQTSKPFVEATYEPASCELMRRFAIDHEKQHQKVCKAKWKDGTQDDYTDVAFFAADDVKAYEAGIATLRKGMEKLAARCGRQPSTRQVKNAPKDVPPPAPRPKLDDARKLSAALGKGKK